ncbi:MAG: RNA-binding domain-containing protein [Chloroflexia bacterium]
MSEKPPSWLRIDWHVHYPVGKEPEQEKVSLLNILRQAEEAGLDILGLVDHNAVRGYEQLRLELNRLKVLQEAGRLSPAEEALWQDYQRLGHRLLLLPGFEVATREGLFLLALFPPETPAEHLYALLLNLGIPIERLREGSLDLVSQADLPTACMLLLRAGGLVLLDGPGWQQLGLNAEALPPGPLALEAGASEEAPAGPLPTVWSSAAFCSRHPAANRPGERYTEVLLERPSFQDLCDLLAGRKMDRIRPSERERLRAQVEQLSRQGPERVILYAQADPETLYRDVAALANVGGGVLLLGLSEEAVTGVEDPERWSAAIVRSVREQIEPPPRLNLELVHYAGQEIIRVEVQPDIPPPYVTRDGVVYVREGRRTRPAGRRELLELLAAERGVSAVGALDLPQAGVEIVGAYLRDGTWFYDIRDMRITSGVTRQRARGLWAYAIERQEALRQGRADLSRVLWKGDYGVWRAYRSGDRRAFDLVHRDSEGRVDHIFYGVSEWGLTPRWREVVETLHPPLEEEPVILAEEAAALRLSQAARPSRGATTYVSRPPAAERPAAVRPTPAAIPEEKVTPAPAEEVAAARPEEERPAEEAPEAPGRPEPTPWGGRIPRWRGQAAVERVYWEGNNLLFDLAMRQADGQVRYFRRVHRSQLSGAEGWVDLVRVPLPPTGVEVVRSTASREEILYQFRDMQTGRVDPRVRRQSEFPPDSPYAYAIAHFHQDLPLDESKVRWWGNIGYLRLDSERVDLVYRDEEGRDHIYYAAERALLNGEWKELLRVWKEE